MNEALELLLLLAALFTTSPKMVNFSVTHRIVPKTCNNNITIRPSSRGQLFEQHLHRRSFKASLFLRREKCARHLSLSMCITNPQNNNNNNCIINASPLIFMSQKRIIFFVSSRFACLCSASANKRSSSWFQAIHNINPCVNGPVRVAVIKRLYI